MIITQEFAGLVKGDVLHGERVALERAVELARLVVPHHDRRVLRRRREDVEHRMESEECVCVDINSIDLFICFSL